jgi:hypothetical protein
MAIRVEQLCVTGQFTSAAAKVIRRIGQTDRAEPK